MSTDDDKPFFKALDFRFPDSDYRDWAAEDANKLVAPLVEEIAHLKLELLGQKENACDLVEENAFLEKERLKLIEAHKLAREEADRCRRAQIARSCGLSVGCLCFYFHSRREPSLWAAIRIANYLEIDLGKLQRRIAKGEK